MSKLKRLRGLRALVEEAVEHGSKAVQEVHIATVARTFGVLEAITPIAKPAKVVHLVHDAYVGGIYGIIRAVNRVVATTAEVAIDLADADANASADASANAETEKG